MNHKPMPSSDELSKLFYYDGENLRWKYRYGYTDKATKGWNVRYANQICGSTKSDGRLTVSIDGRRYPVHRVIMALLGRNIDGYIVDHLDGDPSNNKLDNLRVGTLSDNSRNMKGINGFGGVYFNKQRQKWQTQVKRNGTTICLGRFDCMLDAIAARMRYNRENGYTLRHGR